MLNLWSLEEAAKQRGNPCIFKIFQHVCLIGDQKYMDNCFVLFVMTLTEDKACTPYIELRLLYYRDLGKN